MRAQSLLLLLIGCDVLTDDNEPRGRKDNDDDDNRGDDDDNNDTTEEDCYEHADCPARRPVCCDMGTYNECFQWGIQVDPEQYLCVNDECDVNADCPAARPTCCNLDSVLGVPYRQCVDPDAVYYTSMGTPWQCQ